MLEKQIENMLTRSVKKAGGIALKFVSPSFAGMRLRRTEGSRQKATPSSSSKTQNASFTWLPRLCD